MIEKQLSCHMPTKEKKKKKNTGIQHNAAADDL